MDERNNEKSMEEKNGKLSVIIASKEDENSKKKKSFWHINKAMLPFKMHFFFFIGGMGAILPYLSALAITKLGLTASNIGAAFTAQQFLFLLLKPGIGYLADYFNRLKATIIGLTVLQAMFFFFMVLIPNTDLQIEASQSEILNDNNYCHLCNHTEEFKNISWKQPLSEDVLRQVLHCFQYSQMHENNYEVVYCSKENHNLYSMNISYHILKTTCDYPLGEDLISPTKHTTQHSLYSGDVLFITQSFGSLKNSSIICLHPKENILFRNNFSYSQINQYCQSVPSTEMTDLQYLLLDASYNTTCCQNYKSNISTIQKYEHNAALSTANFKTYQFWIYTVCLVLGCTCCSCIFTISDTACYESIQGADYGKQRAWGAVSWGLVAPFAGFLNDYTEDYMASWFLMVLFCSLQIWNLSKINLVKPDFSQSIFKDLKSVFKSMEFVAFEIGVFLNGAFTGVIWFYLTWFLTTIGGNRLVIGLAHTIECYFGEVPIMFVSGWMIKKFGHFNLVTLALFCHGVRFFLYSYLQNPWLILPIESLHGFTFGSFYSAMTSYGKLNSKPGTEATTQSVLCTTYEALGAGLGCLISGVFFDLYGCHTTFFYTSFVCMAATVLNVVFTILLDCRKGDLKVTKSVINGYSERY